MLRVLLEHSCNEELRTSRHVIRNDQIVIRYLLVEVLVVLAPIREAAAEESEEEDPGGVYVSRWTAEFNLLHDFRCHVRRCSAEKFDLLSVRDLRTEAKVDQLNIAAMVKHDVFQLDVSMCDAF